LVERVVMNLHPSTFVHTSLLDRPKSLVELNRIVGLIEEKSSIARERQRVEVSQASLRLMLGLLRGTPRDLLRLGRELEQ
jgi:hypothetical protein